MGILPLIVDKRLVRLIFAFEFLVALIAVFTLWSQVAAQAHLDIMPWYWKLGLGVAVAFAIVKATAASMDQERAWNLGTLRWLLVIITLGVVCGLVTYYYHLYNEPQNEEDEEDSSITATHHRYHRVRPSGHTPTFAL